MNKQATIGRIIEQEMLANASVMISTLLEDSDGGYVDTLHDCLSAPDYSEPPEVYTVEEVYQDDRLGLVGCYRLADGSEYDTEREAIMAAWEDSGEEPDREEALQHWLVSDWLADKLEEVGGLVARDVLGFNVWGRTECGQSLDYDSTLNRVAELLCD